MAKMAGPNVQRSCCIQKAPLYSKIPESSFKYPLADFSLNIVHGLPQLFGYGLALQRVHVETVCLGGEDEEGYYCYVRLVGF